VNTVRLKALRLSPDQTLCARHFLYTVYAEEMRWLPQKGNPSGWIVERDKQGRYFSDRYDAVASWFGVFDAKEMAAAGRVITPLAGRLEVELYAELPAEFKKKFRAAGTSRAEINRLAVAAKYASTPALSVLMHAMYEYIQGEEIGYLVCGIPEPTRGFALAIGLLSFEPQVRFYYAKGDSVGAEIMYMDCRDKERVKNNIKFLDTVTVQNLKFFD
jgi:hypothetical protein